MAYNEDYKFIEILSLRDDKQIELVLEKNTKELAVRKCIKKPCSFSLYKQIQTAPHRNIVSIYSVQEDEHDVEVIEEYLRGDFCAKQLEVRNFELQEVLDVIIQLCDGLHHLHQLTPAIIHRDIKPENILITKDKCVKLFDFDISRNLVENKRKDTQVLGSVGYAAPEQFGFNQSDARADIYALGVLMNVLLTGSYPNEIECKGPLHSIIRKCVEIDAAKRYQTCMELKSELIKLVKKPLRLKRVYISKPWGFDFPGFRSGRWLNALGAICIYAFILYMTFSMQFEETSSSNSVETGLMKIVMFLWLLITFFLFADYKECFSKQVNKKYKFLKNKIGDVLMLSVFILIALLVLCVSLSSIFDGMLAAYQRLL